MARVRLEIDGPMYRKQARINRRVTYKDIAQEADISVAALNRMRFGQVSRIDTRKVKRISEFLEVSPNEILVWEDSVEAGR